MATPIVPVLRTIKDNKIVTINLQPHFEKIKNGFSIFLRRYCQNRFLLDAARPVISALRSELSFLQAELGNDFLGLALGGSFIRGLGNVRTSDVDYRIYVRKIEPRTALRIRKRMETRLAAAGLKACDRDPFAVLDENQPVKEIITPLSVFSNHLIAVRDRRALRLQALKIIRTLAESGQVNKATLLRAAREEYQALVGCDPEAVAVKFVKNRAYGFVRDEEIALGIANNQKCMGELKKMAQRALPARQLIFPFPRSVAKLLG